MPIDLQKALAEWQEALRLQDWDITAVILSPADYDYKIKMDYRSEGYNRINRWTKKSTITLREEAENDLEFNLVHELVHIIVEDLYGTAEQAISMTNGDCQQVLTGSLRYEAERAINQLTRALLKVRDMAQEAREK